ncbi:hypothetical protein OFB58_24955, partial [Escherichia coli]|nr:hypothetical protein [Escherichia coli]
LLGGIGSGMGSSSRNSSSQQPIVSSAQMNNNNSITATNHYCHYATTDASTTVNAAATTTYLHCNFTTAKAERATMTELFITLKKTQQTFSGHTTSTAKQFGTSRSSWKAY